MLLLVAAAAVLLALPLRAVGAQDLSKIKISYRCANWFRITNATGVAIAATWDVYQQGESGTVTLPGPYGSYTTTETWINTAHRGSFRLSVGGKIIASKSNGGKACSPLATSGQWSGLSNWAPGFGCTDGACVGIHATLLPNGKILTWGRRREGEEPVIYDVTASAWTAGALEISDEFCGGHYMMADGRIMVGGGHPLPPDGDGQGTNNVNVYDWQANTWTALTSMTHGRWYPTTITLADGTMLIAGGTFKAADGTTQVDSIPELYSGTGKIRDLIGAPTKVSMENYPWLFVAPNGLVFHAGYQPTSMWLNVSGNGQWTIGGNTQSGTDRNYGSAVYYDGKVLILGGNYTPLQSTEVIDLNQGTGAQWRYTNTFMKVKRRQLNATLLADGRIFVTSGTNAGGFNTLATKPDSVRFAELFDPTTENWTLMVQGNNVRQYHTTALLLLDGRVIEMGGGEPPPDTTGTGLPAYPDQRNAQFWTPYYLYNPDGSTAQRPLITSAPASSGFSTPMTIQTPNASDITRVNLLRLGSVTHAWNGGQRLNTLSFTAGAGSLTFTIPDANRAPPGFYMIVIVNSRGIPSPGQVIQLP